MKLGLLLKVQQGEHVDTQTVNSVSNIYDTVIEALRFEIEQQVVGILNTVTPSFVVNIIFHDTLTLTHVLSKQLQQQVGTLDGDSLIIKSTIITLKESHVLLTVFIQTTLNSTNVLHKYTK